MVHVPGHLEKDQKGNFHELKIDAVDPNDIEDDPEEPRFGLPRLLNWTLYNKDQEDEYWEAEGKDGKIYRIESDEPPKPKKKGKAKIYQRGPGGDLVEIP